MNPIDLDKEQPYNLTEIIRVTDDMIDMLTKLNCAYPVFYGKIKHLKECKNLYNMTRVNHPHLFKY